MKKVVLRENLHIHSNTSWDCMMKLEEIVPKLIENKIKIAGITDIIDFDREDSDDIIEKFKIRNFNIDILNEKYFGKIKILKGAEILSPHQHVEEVKHLEELDLDMIIGSIHKLKTSENNASKRRFSEDYYYSILDMVRHNQIDIVGHLDYINRYTEKDYIDNYILDTIFSELKEKDMVLEINASSIKHLDQLCYPTVDKLKEYKLFKDEVTIGTDAHKLGEITHNLNKINDLARELELVPVYFEKRKKKVLNPSTYS